ncbi:hypothetical protein HD598_001289 [Neomicrococcus aestuarii]|uniref:site-specific DNA-methyltransferase (adenine-specific) n=1 Tax=Neomicrococcus aestuarii TaxID=556325 RepID=A0A7W8WZU3_9MICC|nr:DNA methyltransferase [Neomicrococcus aestuarii]MBB5512602.1 hypothetical protein [Neomicrococcus aestuarii]
MAKPLVFSDIRNRAGSFVAQWRDAEGYERGEAQSFVRDLLGVFGITNSTAAVYEKRAQRASTGQGGYIDALISGTALIEMKSTGRDLVAAEAQALDYIESLTVNERPDYVITSDFKKFRLLSLVVEPGEEDTIEFPLEALPDHVEDLMFLAGYRQAKFGSKEQEQASIKAANLMARLYEHLESTGYDDHQASVFLIRTLFCLYADDAGLWERDLFSRYLEERTSEDGSDLGSQLTTLYQALNKPEDKRYAQNDDLIQAFPYVNGSVFGEPTDIPYFDRGARELLIQAAYFNWSSISPAIFGSLFQAVKDKKARRELGEHYTTETNILKLIRPLFLDELEERFTKAYAKKNELEKLLQHLGTLNFLDPACGCGNFLIIAYRELRALELRIHNRLQELDPARTQLSLMAESLVHVKLSQFHGIEIEEWPATIARTAMFLVEHQANQAVNLTLGYAVPMLPLEDSAQITVGNALRTDWSELVPASESTYILGNPPFIGHQAKAQSQRDDLKVVWGDLHDGTLDYVTAWFKKSSDFFQGIPGGRFAFVSTNSIAQGQGVLPLFKPLFDAGWRIRFAHQTFAWASEAPGAAAVHCVITGYDKNEKTEPVLYSYTHIKGQPQERTAKSINAYLIDGPNVLIGRKTKPVSDQIPTVHFGTMPADGGNLVVEFDDYSEIASDPIAAKYLRPFKQSRELVRGLSRWCLWMADSDFDPADINKSSILKERVDKCRVWRTEQPTGGDAYKLRHTPHLFRGNQNRPLSPYVAIPRVVSETRRFYTVQLLPETVIAGDALFTAMDPDGFLFSVISSSSFMTWQRAVGGFLKSDIRFSNTVVWNNLPLPEVDSHLREQIIEAGRDVRAARDLYPERSLADHYNPLAMSPELLKAHAALDRVVDKAFGAKRALQTNEQRLALLFERYIEMG